MKRCTTCKRLLEADFYRLWRPSTTLRSRCKRCFMGETNERNRTALKIKFSGAWFRRKYYKLKDKAKKRRIAFMLTINEFRSIRIQEACIYCGVKDATFTIDRKNNDLSYVPSNCVLACWRCNMLKSNLFSYEEMLLLGLTLRKIDLKRKKQVALRHI